MLYMAYSSTHNDRVYTIIIWNKFDIYGIPLKNIGKSIVWHGNLFWATLLYGMGIDEHQPPRLYSPQAVITRVNKIGVYQKGRNSMGTYVYE